jgi:hypothetical protein
MRRLYLLEELEEAGLTRENIRAMVRARQIRCIRRGVYGEGSDTPSDLDKARADVLVVRGIATGRLAGVLRGLDSVTLVPGKSSTTVLAGSNRCRSGVRRRNVVQVETEVIGQVPCTDLVQTITDLAAELSDLVWEQALESGLRQGMPLEAIELASRSTFRGVRRIRRVLALRPPDAPPTESLLETLMVQLIRTIPGVPPPVRQYRVYNKHGEFVARVDLCWPDLGVFIELDGQQHPGQPEYDAARQTAVSAAMGWMVGRFTWREVRHNPVASARRLAELIESARGRPVVA